MNPDHSRVLALATIWRGDAPLLTLADAPTKRLIGSRALGRCRRVWRARQRRNYAPHR